MYLRHDSPRLERLPSVMARTGMGRSWIYKEIAAGRFPAPMKIGRASGWRGPDIDAWIDNLTAATPQGVR